MSRSTSVPVWAGAACGVIAAACGVAAGELVAGVDERLRGPIAAVGDRVIDNVPVAVKQWAISSFGTNDKAVLLGGVTILLAAFAVLVGIIAVRRSIRAGLVGVGAFAAVGVLASFGRGGTGWARPVPPVVAGVIAGWVLVVLARAARAAWPSAPVGQAAPLAENAENAENAEVEADSGADPRLAPGVKSVDGGAATATATAVDGADAHATANAGAKEGPRPGVAEPMVIPGLSGTADRRRFLQLGGGLAAAAIVAGGAGRWLQSRAVAVSERLKVVLPKPAQPLPPVPVATHAEGAVPFITPNDDFYRIDTALVVPRVSTEGWTLDVTGRVRRKLSFTYEQLLDRPLIEADITISCVSNEVGGELIGTARWLGCRLDDLLAEAGIDPSADQIVGRSVDGFTAGFPTSLLDGRPALVAVGMNGEPLPIDHGYPARLIVPGVYGYVSATKWLTQIELTRFDEFDAYWIPRGWSRLGPIKTQSRIDTPRDGKTLTVGQPAAVAGVAWAMDRGVSRVEVRIAGSGASGSPGADGWQDATLAEEHNDTTWRQWSLAWTPSAPGSYTITVRATDGLGDTQPEEQTEVAPDGATGWHQVRVTVT